MNLKTLFATALAATALTAAAAGPQRIAVGQGAHHPVLSPDGTTLLYSSLDHTGLQALDLVTGKVTTLDESASAGFQPVFSADGRTVFYRTATMADGLLYRDIRAYEFDGTGVRTLAAPSRKDERVAALAGNTYAYADFDKIEVSTAGVRKTISPVPEAHTYQWAAISPDASSLAFCEPFQGVFVSSTDGTGLRRLLDKGDYIAWAGPSKIIAVVSKDDGYVILESRLVLVDVITGETEFITAEDIKVSEATAAPSGLVVFSDLAGNLYSLNINER